MLQFLWLTRLRERWFGKLLAQSRKRHRPVARRRLYRRLELERLEYRIVPSVTVLNSFQGANLDSAGGAPPDTQGAAGPNSYEQTVNSTVSFYNKSTGATITSDTLDDFFFSQGLLPHVAPPNDFLGDAFSTYDSVAGRFIVGDIDVQTNPSTGALGPGNALVLAVSKTSNPTTMTKANWNFFEINTQESGVELQDYPGNIGYNDGAVVITLNYFGTGASHVLVNSISANALATNAPLTLGTNYFQNDFSGFNLRPATMQDSTSPNDPMWFVEEGGDNQSINVVKMSSATGALTSTPTFTTTNLAVNPYFTAVTELQPDGSGIPGPGYTDSRIMNASMQNGMLVAAHQVSDLAGNLDEIQWYEFNTSGVAPTLQQQGDVSGGAGTYYAYPGIAINSSGDIGMSYVASGVGANQFMSTYVTGRNPSDPVGTMEPSKLVIAGTVDDTFDGREGDMSAINVDTDGSFWIGNEIAAFNPVSFGGVDSWSTAIGHFTLGVSVGTKASNAAAVFSPNTQSLALSATVTNINTPSSKVNEGTITFTIKSGSTVVGTTTGAVFNGVANANFTLPAGLAAGTYTIASSYTDSLGNFQDVNDVNGTLTISPAKASTSANNFFGFYSPNKQVLALTATLADNSIATDKVSEGVVTFTVKNGATTIGKTTGTVSNGTATGFFNLPAGQPLGSYSISVNYTDSGLGNFTDNGDTGATLKIQAANVITSASSFSVAYSPTAQTVQLNATVLDSSIPSDTVSEGVVTFTVEDSNGNQVGSTVQNSVNGGLASASFNLAPGQARGNYTILVSYNDSAGNFADSGDVSGILNLATANVTTTANNFTAFYSPNGQSLALKATLVNDSYPTQTVNEGTVTFTVLNGSSTIGTATGSVSGGIAIATPGFALPAGQAAGSYTIEVSYSDSAGNFTDSGDVNGTLIVTPASVTTTAAAANLTFSTAAQTVPLSATLADNNIPGDTVNAGIVTFTIEDNQQNVIGNVFANVVGGAASTNFNWSAGRAAGKYTILVSYKDAAGNYIDSNSVQPTPIKDNSNTLTVAAASVTTTASSPPAIVSSSNSQTVTLNASIADKSFSGDTVNEGTVTFTVKDGNGNTIGSPVQGTVVAGKASAAFSVPGGQAVGNYSVNVSYSDSAGNFSDTGDTSGTLTINPANVATTANNASAIYSPNLQTLALSATVANTSVPANTVGEGIVTFTVKSGNTIISTATGNVSGGIAIANPKLNLPALLAPGTYSITVSYSDSAGNFIDAGDTGATLTITPAKVTTTASKVSTFYSPNLQTLALSAAVPDVSNSADTVNEGTVTFTIKSGSVLLGTATGNVVNGTANANFNLPAGQALGTYTIGVSYSDTSGNFTDSGDTGSTLTISPANVTATANNATVVYSPKAQPLALSAAVADTSIATDTVNEGTVTFTVTSGSTVLGSTQGTVINGTANANFNLPAGQANGSYTISVSYNNNSGHFLDNGDTSGTLTISSANVTTKANNASAAFSVNTQTVALSATVTDASISADVVSQGSVTFTVMNGSTKIASATGLVSGGKANATLGWPAGQALGNYSIVVSYNDSANNFTDSGDTGATLTVSAAKVTTTAGNVSTVYSTGSQVVALAATVLDTSVPSDIVTQGIVTFTIQSGGVTLGTVQGTVSNGAANANFTVGGGQNAGNYTIGVSYSDSTGHFTDSGDVNGTLTITPASTSVSASSASTAFSTGAQILSLGATVTDPGPAIPNIVNEGVVTFTILSGSTVIGSVQGGVSGGTAHANFTLPAGQNTGNYTIAVHYSDGSGNFADTGDTGGSLAVGTAATTVQLLSANFSPNYANLTVTETVTAHVASSSLVNRGVVTFVLSGQTITANVDGNGNATAVLNLPMLDLLNPQTINISYADAGHNLTASTNTQTASWQLSNPLFPSYAAFSSNGQALTLDLFGLFITFTNGALTEIDFGSDHLVFSYNASNQLIGISFDGMNLLP